MKVVRTILVTFYCLMILLSSSSFMIGIHFCSGQVQDVALFTEAQRCVNDNKIPPCNMHESKPCCEDEAVVHKGDDLKVLQSDINLITLEGVDIEQPPVFISEIIPSAPLSRIQYHNYDPPPRSCDFRVEQQVFLI